MFQRGAIVLFRKVDVGLASRVQSVGIPAQGLGLFNGALRIVAERTRPVDRELRPQLMTDPDRVPETPRGILADLWRFCRGAGRPHRLDEWLGRDHATFQAI